MQYVDLVGALAAFQLLFFGVMTGLARGKSGLKAPAVTGDEGFERMYRVQVNTIELIVPFLAGLYIASKYWSPTTVAGIGAVYLLGRLIYWRAYVAEPSTRSIGFVLSMLPTIILVVMAVLGVLMSVMA